ncbi:ABC transporter ATP-binding protein [Paenibacillus sp. IHBB 10380]|uniref:ABC transporter ATP-binding protein n=1 Tax=Paenibacillus sp. IHBB 10380 TaxID=1566358 RepID=UPI0005CF9B04|nr:ABC transporter ATP-binding protein [Paenibacillus sp. IHBB 10380]AJS58479.1 ABC transporter [Paenibacillus sp. IHBB 10380]
MNYCLEVKSLSKTYPGSNFSLDNVSFSIPQGSIMGFVGENGAGKTTTISSILNVVKRDSGMIKIFGEEMTEERTDILNNIGVVFDAINFPEALTANRLAAVFNDIYQKWDGDLFRNLIRRLQVPAHIKIKDLSRGMTMKLAVAVALSHGAKLLLLDEATSGLDPVVREEMLDLFLEFVENEEHSILMSSHITSDLEKIADYITFIHNGKIILTEQKDLLLYKYGIARCKVEQFQNLDKLEYLAYRKRGLQIDVLISNKGSFAKKHHEIIVDDVTIDEIMLLLVKGDK